MMYSDIVTKLRNKETVYDSEISGYQLIMLLQDREIKTIRFENTLYEINFNIITYSFSATDITEENCPTMRHAQKVITDWVNHYKSGLHSYICMDNEYFEIIIDVLETKE